MNKFVITLVTVVSSIQFAHAFGPLEALEQLNQNGFAILCSTSRVNLARNTTEDAKEILIADLAYFKNFTQDKITISAPVFKFGKQMLHDGSIVDGFIKEACVSVNVVESK